VILIGGIVLGLALFLGGWVYPLVKAIMCNTTGGYLMALLIFFFPPAGLVFLFMPCPGSGAASAS
jgi:hypothetical protein